MRRTPSRLPATFKRSHCAILPLVLKREWYDMIARGEKREEYRNEGHYWATRLSNWDNTPAICHVVEFRLGYAKDAPRIAFTCPIYISAHGSKHPEWGEPEEPHYTLLLGRRVFLED